MIKKILFIEDETHIAELYAMVLRKEGYEVAIAKDGKDGLRLGQSGKYDLVLLDLMLPNMSGQDILYTLKNPKKSPKFKGRVIILTNFGENDKTRRKLQYLSEGYLLKVNYTPRDLFKYVQMLDTAKKP